MTKNKGKNKSKKELCPNCGSEDWYKERINDPSRGIYYECTCINCDANWEEI